MCNYLGELQLRLIKSLSLLAFAFCLFSMTTSLSLPSFGDDGLVRETSCYWNNDKFPEIACGPEVVLHSFLEAFFNAWLFLISLPILISVSPLKAAWGIVPFVGFFYGLFLSVQAILQLIDRLLTSNRK